MTKKLRFAFALIAAVLLGFVLGFFAHLHLNSRSIYITIVNNSDQQVASIKFTDDSSGNIQLVENLLPGKTKKIEYYTCSDTHSEADYVPKVLFMDGSTLSGDSRYVEPGYQLTETITNKEIKVDYLDYGF